jgi:hypothetical protein
MSDDGVEEREDAQCWEGKRRTTVLARLVSRRCMYTDGVQTDPAGSNNRCSEVESVPWDELSVFPDTDQSFLDKGLALGCVERLSFGGGFGPLAGQSCGQYTV